jgi:hypothetical protein
LIWIGLLFNKLDNDSLSRIATEVSARVLKIVILRFDDISGDSDAFRIGMELICLDRTMDHRRQDIIAAFKRWHDSNRTGRRPGLSNPLNPDKA